MARRVKQSQKKYSRKVKQAVQLLFFKHHRIPGVRGWELKQDLGSDWLEVLEALEMHLKPLDLQVTRVLDEPDLHSEPSRSQLTEARYYITLKGTVDQRTAKTIGWRIDDIAGLGVSVAFLISKHGKAPRIEVEKILAEKLPGWRAKLNIDRYIEQGYLGEDDQGILFLDWRSRAEIDQKKLVDLVLAYRKGSG